MRSPRCCQAPRLPLLSSRRIQRLCAEPQDRRVEQRRERFDLLRVWLASHPVQEKRSWLGGLSDPVISQALTKLHQDPAREWTTATLAAETAVSRATLSRRFPEVVGQTPAAYLTQWRMDLAAQRLRDTDNDLETIACSVGYTSVYAFSRAFSRTRGEPPGRYRVTSRTRPQNSSRAHGEHSIMNDIGA